MKRKSDWLFCAGVVSVIAMYFFAISLVAATLGKHEPRDLFWYGLGTMVSGVVFKTIFDHL